MDTWILLAISERTAQALGLLLGAHCADIAGDRTEAALLETQWALELIACLIDLPADDELADMVRMISTVIKRRLPSGHSELGLPSRRLNWPADAAWIEAQSRDGKLAPAGPTAEPPAA